MDTHNAPSSTRFFSIPELVTIVLSHLPNRASRSYLSRTCRNLHILCSPSLFRNLTIHFESILNENRKKTIFESAEATMALSRNIHFIRSLDIYWPDMAFLTNCIFAYQDLIAHASFTSVTGTGVTPLVSRRPRWLAPPDPRICSIIPLPPLTLLTILRISLEMPRNSFWMKVKKICCPYQLPSAIDPRAGLTQVCWLLRLNPHLEVLDLVDIPIRDRRDLALLVTSIGGLSNLRELELSGVQYPQLLPLVALIGHCPASVQVIMVYFKGHKYSKFDVVSQEYIDAREGDRMSWEQGDVDDGGGDDEVGEARLILQREEPLEHLTELSIQLDYVKYDEEEFLTIFKAAPNILKLEVPFMLGEEMDCTSLARKIVERCPSIRELTQRDYEDSRSEGEILFRIMEALPPNQIEVVTCGSLYIQLDVTNKDLSLWARHTMSLRRVHLHHCSFACGDVTEMLLKECPNLEVLNAHWNGASIEHVLDLEVAINFPWACTKIRKLELTIGFDDGITWIPEKGAPVPYYDRPPPLTLTDDEKQAFGKLERFYRQIGSLVHLKRLHLNARHFDMSRQGFDTYEFEFPFPALLSLGCEQTGRPGFLNLLGGLKNLKTLRGSFRMDQDETKKTVGQPEIEWIDKHWSLLKEAQFFDKEAEATNPFKWLQAQRTHNRPPLKLTSACWSE